ncbi:CinA family protein [Williamsoniiplasma lucivorax]|uniref:Competence damage-inducible protein A n=1 Tax=Williamsoniiplasma lucivorax TaxID=209274 RepID=A0A2S5RDQ2_9MOLU|nr:CinA family protein [Williamsoniiplasma lucivorax]PPE05255.1 competence damage-inducible protein A [Williamsoniiplasma lucivorax]
MEKLGKQIIEILKAQNLKLASVESFTGGMFANELTNIPGASEVFYGGYVAYSNEFKIKHLKVKKWIIKKYGVVSQEVAEEMVKQLIKQTKAHVGVSFTGNAGPTTNNQEQVGVGYICVWYLGSMTSFKVVEPELSRIEFKINAISVAFSEILQKIQKNF